MLGDEGEGPRATRPQPGTDAVLGLARARGTGRCSGVEQPLQALIMQGDECGATSTDIGGKRIGARSQSLAIYLTQAATGAPKKRTTGVQEYCVP
jgi:hypothetical protein